MKQLLLQARLYPVRCSLSRWRENYDESQVRPICRLTAPAQLAMILNMNFARNPQGVG